MRVGHFTVTLIGAAVVFALPAMARQDQAMLPPADMGANTPVTLQAPAPASQPATDAGAKSKIEQAVSTAAAVAIASPSDTATAESRAAIASLAGPTRATSQSSDPFLATPSEFAGEDSTTSNSMMGLGVTDVLRLAGALGLVIGLIFLARLLAMKIGGKSGFAGREGLVRVLQRVPTGHKQAMVVVKFGDRLVLLGDSAGRLTALSEVDDPDEVAMMLASCGGESSKRFGSLLGRARRRFDDGDSLEGNNLEVEEQEAAQPREALGLGLGHESGELAGLLGKVRSVRQNLGHD